MTRIGLIWILAVGASLGAHAAGAVLLYLATRPGDIPEQPVPETRLELSAYQVDRSRARETAPDVDEAISGDTAGTAVGQGAVVVSRASPVDARRTRATAVAAQGDRVAANAPPAPTAETITNAAEPLAAVSAPQMRATSAALAPTMQASALVVPTTPVSRPAQTVPATPLSAAAPPATRPVETAIAAALAQETDPDPELIVQKSVDAQRTTSLAPEVDRAKAVLALQGSGDGPVDPVSLSAFQSFMQPGDLGGAAADVRDGITGILSAVPCSRLQVEFDPTDNTLVVAGHVPEPDLRASVVAALQQQMGTDIPVRDNLLILPRPQCGALSGIARVGLPQSTDQITNPLLVGESTHAREFRYTAGSPLVMSLQGADYDAYVYVDYFDADGNVVHLSPNQFTPLTLTPAQASLQIGSETALAPGEPGLYIEIGPPFGQEIAAAFAASVPLYDGVRPLVEPAGPYLDWLQDRVAEARAAHPDFKGEWVYFFVATAAE